jgi:hypothetical protein
MSDKPKLKVQNPTKPCHELNYCPYGVLVEYFPLNGHQAFFNGVKLDWIKPREDAEPCHVFGHECPVYHVAENMKEDS